MYVITYAQLVSFYLYYTMLARYMPQPGMNGITSVKMAADFLQIRYPILC